MRRIAAVVDGDGRVTHYRCSECAWYTPVLSLGSLSAVLKSTELAERAFDRHDCSAYERRFRRARFLVRGRAQLRAEAAAEAAAIAAQPLNLGYGGMLVLAEQLLPIGTELTALFKIEAQPEAVAVRSRVAHAGAGEMGLAFKEAPVELDRVLQGLTEQNYS